MSRMLGVGVIGAHDWAEKAHLPGYKAYERAKLIAICDIDYGRAKNLADQFDIPHIYTDYHELLENPDIEMVDVCTPSHTHLPISLDVIRAGKHVLSEKPLADLAKDAFAAATAARQRGVHTKLGFTFRYSPAIRQLKTWVSDGTLGEIFHIHGYEQNYQFLDPDFPLRQVPLDAPRDQLIPGSIVGYGSHLVDMMRWLGGEFSAVVGTMHNFVPERVIRGAPGRQRIPVEDATAATVEFASGAHGILQTSYIAVGNYPGIEIRIYGSKGAAIARLIDENNVAETLTFATPDDIAFRRIDLPASTLPPGTSLATPWPELYYRNLVRNFVDEILDNGPPDCTFYDGAKSQEIVNAVIQSHRERRWVDLPLYPEEVVDERL